jgi:hypothetical protein
LNAVDEEDAHGMFQHPKSITKPLRFNINVLYARKPVLVNRNFLNLNFST